MELRHLRCFIAVAEELHFARAAARLHIEQSPLSRIIKELEYRLGVQLFERTTRRTRLTWAGKVLLKEARRVLAVVDQAKASVKSAAAGYRGRIRVALSDGIPQARLAALLAQCREEEPEIEICLSEVTFSEQVRGLNDDLFDIGLAQSDEVGEGLVAEPVWFDPPQQSRRCGQTARRLCIDANHLLGKARRRSGRATGPVYRAGESGGKPSVAS